MENKNILNYGDYDKIIIAFSGGKDSLACALHALEGGVPVEKIELWHHDVDGREGSTLMDWPVTRAYCKAIAQALNIPLYFSWKQGGFEREMLRDNALTAPTLFETPDGVKRVGGTRGNQNTRMKFPQISPNLSVRWCSAYLKIDICSTAIRNQDRFIGKKVLLVSGERAEESKSRANYKTFEPDRSDNRQGKTKPRHVDRHRPVHSWTEQEVWTIISRWNLDPHPAYHLGWGRVSCAACIFGSKHQWASLAQINPAQVQKIADYEVDFRFTINRTHSVPELIRQGTPYPGMKQEYVSLALSEDYKRNPVLDNWTLPAGAFGEACGPT